MLEDYIDFAVDFLTPLFAVIVIGWLFALVAVLKHKSTQRSVRRELAARPGRCSISAALALEI